MIEEFERHLTEHLKRQYNNGLRIGAITVSQVVLDLLNDTIGLGKSADGRKYYAKIFRNGISYCTRNRRLGRSQGEAVQSMGFSRQ